MRLPDDQHMHACTERIINFTSYICKTLNFSLILVVTTGRGACRKDFVDYGDFCFKTYGDRVKLWASMNEPNGMVMNGYNVGSFAPGRCSNYVGNCTAGDSATEPYIAAHTMLLSHGALVNLYKHKYQVFRIMQITSQPVAIKN